MCIYVGPHTVEAVVQTTNVSLSWQQEQPTVDLRDYEIEVRYTGPCLSAINVSQTASIPISSRTYVFEDLIAFGMYDVIITAVSVTNQRASLRSSIQTLSSG